MAARSVVATLVNQTSSTLTLDPDVVLVTHGQWDVQPPATIAPHASGSWSSESDGTLTGTEAEVAYKLPSGEVFTGYDNPFLGQNTARISYPQGYEGVAQITDGNDAVATYTLTGP